MLYAPINGLPQDRGRTNPREFGHFNFQEDNFPTLGPNFNVKFPSLLEAFFNDFLFIQNGWQKVEMLSMPKSLPWWSILRTNWQG